MNISMSVLFPDPVSPTMPTICPFWMLNDESSSINELEPWCLKLSAVKSTDFLSFSGVIEVGLYNLDLSSRVLSTLFIAVL